MGKISFPPTSPTDDIFKTGLGVVSWNYNPQNIATQTAFTAGTIYCAAIPLRAGQIVTNVLLDVEVASSGTAPTSFFVGISNATTQLAQSSNLSAGTFTQSINTYALNATYTVLTSGLYYVNALIVGAFSVTQPSFGRASGRAGIGAILMSATAGTSQTALPANNAAVAATLTSTNALNFWAGVS